MFGKRTAVQETPKTPPQAEPPPERDTMSLDPDTLFAHPPVFANEAPWSLGEREQDRGVVASYDPAFPLDAKPGSTKAAPLLVLAVVSLVLFAGGVFGGLNAASDTSGSLLTAKAISWMLCVVGAVGFVVAAYLLLRQLDAGDEG